MSSIIHMKRRRMVIVGILLLIAAVHILRIGSYLPERLSAFYYSYFSDFILPLGFYFLLCASELQLPGLRRWETKLAIAFLMPAFAETCQYFKISILGSTFDPLDYLMYGAGAILAVVLDTQVFSRILNFWGIEGDVL